MFFHKKGNRKKGFTLVELLFVLLVFTIFMMSLIKITMDGLKIYRRGVSQTEMKQQLRRAMSAITNDVRQAVPESGTSGWTHPDYQDDATDPVLQLNFYRYVYDGADPNIPDTRLIEYKLVEDVDDTYKLTRIETIGGSPRYNVLATNLVVDSSAELNGSHFRWGRNGMNTALADNSVLIVRLLMKKYHGGGINIPETIDLTTEILARSEPTAWNQSPAHFTQYNVFMDVPSSLIDPR